MVLNILVVTKMLKPLDRYVFFLLKWVHIEEILIKQYVYLLLIKYEKLFNENIMKFGKKLSNIKKEFNNLIENPHKMKNI